MHKLTSDGQHASRHTPITLLAAMAVALAMGMLVAVPVSAQLVNGDFEGTPQSAPYTTVSSGSFIEAANAWKVTLGSVNVGTGPAGTRCVTSGTHCIDLNGNNRGRIEQVMAIGSGTRCTLTFSMSRHKNLATGSATLRTFVNGAATVPATFTHAVAGVNDSDGKWEPHSFVFTTTGATTTLAFESAVEGAAGPQVDNVAMSCAPPPRTGTLSVRKIVVNTLGVATPATFNVVTHCSMNAATLGVNTPMVVAAGQTLAQSAQHQAGIGCSVTEVVPPPIRDIAACKGGSASWVAAYSPPVTIASGMNSVLTVTNTLACDPPTGGVLTVHKVVVNTLGVPNAAAFNMVAHCSAVATAPAITAPLAVAPNQSVVVGTIAGGSICNVTEPLPAPVLNVKACNGGRASWTQNIPAPVTMQAGQSTAVLITNTLRCDPATTGWLTVHKIVVNPLNIGIGAPFNIVAHCAVAGSPAVSTPVSVTAGQGVTLPAPSAAGSLCSATEVVPQSVVNVKACDGRNASWIASYSAPVTIVGNGTVALTVTNTLRCDPAPAGGHLTVYKAVINTLGVPTPSSFNITAHCSPSGPNNAALSIPANGGVSVAAPIASNSSCTATETPPPSIPNVKACNGGSASWVASYSQAVTITAGATASIRVTNTLTCDKPTNTGSLRVVKSVANSTGGPVTMPATFAMSVNCSPSGPSNQGISVAPGATGTTIAGIVAPGQCTVTEAPLAPIARAEGCRGESASWAAVTTPAQPASITANGTTTVTVRNTLTCDKPTATNCANPTQTTLGCRLTVTVKRTKGQPIYSVLIAPAATTPTPNIAPSTSSSCVIAGGAMINQTTCWFNYNTNPQPVTLTATSSAGALPPGFSWSGACSGSNATCVVSVTLGLPPSVIANFP